MKTMRKTLLAAAVAGSMLFAGTVSAQQADRSDRTTAAQTESDRPMSDAWITTKVKAALLAESDVSGLDVTVETANGTVSLSGDVDNRAQIDRATAVARDIEGVRSVDAKQLVVNTSRDRSSTMQNRRGSAMTPDRADNRMDRNRSDRTTAANTDSDQPMSDTWITTKVKAALLAERDVSGLDITVETANGTVSLSGDVDNRAQIDRATAVARDIEGVRSVDAKQLVVNTSRDRSTSANRNAARGADNRNVETAAGRNDRSDRGMNSNTDRSDRTVAANTESNQPVSDTWITTKVKADLLATSDVSGLDISVETANGIVSLSGEVESRAQIQRAEAIARDIEGVQRVDTSQLRVGARAADRN